MKKIYLFTLLWVIACISLHANSRKVGVFYVNNPLPSLVQFEDSMLTSQHIEYVADVINENNEQSIVYSNKIIVNSSASLEKILEVYTDHIKTVDTLCLRHNVGCFSVEFRTENIHNIYSNLKQNVGCDDIQINRFIFIQKEEPQQSRQSLTSDDYTSEQWGLNNTEYPDYDINIEDAWTITKGEGVTIGIIDNGVDLEHEDLVDNLLPGYDAIRMEYGNTSGACELGDVHGTYCAGIIGAMENSYGITGVAPRAKMIPIRGVLNILDQTITSTEYLLRSLIYAIDNEVHVANCSWKDIGDFSIINDYLLATNSKTILVFSSGNDNLPTIENPANQDFALTVGAISHCGERTLSRLCGIPSASGSNYGPELELVAPGTEIRTTRPLDSYYFVNGSSYATSFVTGVVALRLSVNPDLTREEVHEIICRTAYKLPNYTFTNDENHPYGSWNEEVGYGLVDASTAVFMAMSKRFYIAGPDSFCHSARYYIENVPAYADVQWIRTGIHDFDPDWVDLIDSTNFSLPVRKLRISNIWTDTINVQPGENIGFTPEGYYEPIPYSGFAELRPQVSYQNKIVRIEKEIYVEEQLDPGISAYISFFPELDEGSDNLLVGIPYYFKSALFPDEDELEWTIITAGDTITGIGRQTDTITARHDSIFVSVYNPNTDECLNTALCTKLFTTMEFIGMDFANPANEVVDIQVVHELPVDESQMYSLRARGMQALLYEGECEVELWDMYHGKLRSVSGTGGYVQMPLQGIASGNYVLRLIVNEKQVDSKPLMIR